MVRFHFRLSRRSSTLSGQPTAFHRSRCISHIIPIAFMSTVSILFVNPALVRQANLRMMLERTVKWCASLLLQFCYCSLRTGIVSSLASKSAEP